MPRVNDTFLIHVTIDHTEFMKDEERIYDKIRYYRSWQYCPEV